MSFVLASLSSYCLTCMSLHISNMELKNLWIGEGRLPRREEEHGEARGGGEAPPPTAPPVGASAFAVAASLGPVGGTPILGRSTTIFRAL